MTSTIRYWFLPLLLVVSAVRLRAQDEAAALAAEKAGRVREAVHLYMAALQALPDLPPAEADQRLRERILHLVRRMEAPPPIPDDSVRHATWGSVAFKDAQDRQGFEKAAEEFRKAVRLAPWNAPAVFNLGLVQEKLERYAEAQANLRLYLLAAPQAPNADQVRGKLYEIEYRLKQRADRLRAYGAGEEDIPKERAEARAFFDEACEAGLPRGCADLAVTYRVRDVKLRKTVVVDGGSASRIAELLERSCQGGYMTGCAQLAGEHRDGVLPKDLPRAVELYQRACDGNVGFACEDLAEMHESGEGVAKDRVRAAGFYQKTARLYQPLCEAGKPGDLRVAATCQTLGEMYLMGKGVAKDKAQAISWLERSCDLVHTLCGFMGITFEIGVDEIKRDKRLALRFYRKGCDHGEKSDCEAAARLE